MTTIETSRVDFPLVIEDLYRDIHKGIRSELFALTLDAGRIDPSDRAARTAVASHLHDVVGLLVSHAEHEDSAVQPALELHLPELAEKIAADHVALEARLVLLEDLAASAVDAAGGAQRETGHRLYLELASFTSAYLEHQDVEERVLMPALEATIGVEAVFAIHQAIVSSIPPDEMAASLAVMLPAMNIDDRAAMLGGMQAGAPAEVFAGVWALAGSVLTDADHAALGARLGL